MPNMPVLRVVPLARIRRHEKVDPIRVDRLTQRIATEGIQVNPMICSEAPSGDLALLDGATRTEALRGLGLEFAVIQLVEPEDVRLETWHHVIRGCPPRTVLDAVTAAGDLSLTEDTDPPRLHTAADGVWSVRGEGVSANATLSALVETYIGRWTVSRVADPATESVEWRFPDWSAVVEFPTLTFDDVMLSAESEDLLPAGITRFLVSERALRLNADLTLLTSPGTQADKQEALDGLLEARAQAGRVRRYEETVYILDD